MLVTDSVVVSVTNLVVVAVSVTDSVVVSVTVGKPLLWSNHTFNLSTDYSSLDHENTLITSDGGTVTETESTITFNYAYASDTINYTRNYIVDKTTFACQYYHTGVKILGTGLEELSFGFSLNLTYAEILTSLPTTTTSPTSDSPFPYMIVQASLLVLFIAKKFLKSRN